MSISGLDEKAFFLMVPVQEGDGVDRQGEGGEVLFYFALQDIGPRGVQHVAALVIYFREEDGLIKPGGVLEGDELHGVAVLAEHGLPGHHPADGGHLLAYMEMEIAGPHVVQFF